MLTMFPKFELVPLYDFMTFGILLWVIDVSPLACLWVLPGLPDSMREHLTRRLFS